MGLSGPVTPEQRTALERIQRIQRIQRALLSAPGSGSVFTQTLPRA